MSVQGMDTLSPGQWAIIDRVEDSTIRDRLLQLGFEQGERVCRMYTDRHSFISAYRVEHSLIGLRRPDAATVLVRV